MRRVKFVEHIVQKSSKIIPAVYIWQKGEIVVSLCTPIYSVIFYIIKILLQGSPNLKKHLAILVHIALLKCEFEIYFGCRYPCRVYLI